MKKAALHLQRTLRVASLALIAAILPMAVHAAAPQCQLLFEVKRNEGLKPSNGDNHIPKLKSTKELRGELETNYKNRNEILAKRYPQLEFVFKDPEAFVKAIKQRFEEQKQITPEDPRLFNFPEAASTMHEIRVELEKFRQEVIVDLQSKKDTFRNRISHMIRGKRSEKVETLTKVLKYIRKLQSDIDRMVETDNYPYLDTVYTLYYYSRIRGIFQFKDLGTYYQVAKYIDMHMHGFRRLNIDSELRLYEAKGEAEGSPIIQVRSGKMAHEFRAAEVPFRDAFERRDVLEYVIIPSVVALGQSAFMHVLPHKIHFVGATNTPVEADGFSRPGGLFWMHDIRHEADRYMKSNAYRKAQNLTSQQEQSLLRFMHKWHAEFLQLKNSIQDADLKASLEHYHFYTHHDVGVPLIPSMFLGHHTDGILVYYSFLWHKQNAGQNPAFKDWIKNTRKAQAILTQFWKERLPLEKQLLQKNPLGIKNWEEWFPMSHRQSKSQVAVFNQAIESAALVRVMTDVGGVDGILSKVFFGQNGDPIFLQFAGKAQLVDRGGQVIPGQGHTVHSQGYSTPVGKIKSILVNGVKSDVSELKPQQGVEIEYESGISVRGELKGVTLDGAKASVVLTFNTAEVKLGDKTLYKPDWGSFDLLIGERIRSLEYR